MSIRVLVIADPTLLIDLLDKLTTPESALEVFGRRPGERSTTELVVEANPAVVILHVRTMTSESLSVIREVSMMDKPPGIVSVTTPSTESEIVRLLAEGSSGVLPATANSNEFMRAILEVLAGRLYISPGATHGNS